MFSSNYKPLTLTTPRWRVTVKNNRWQSRCISHGRTFVDLKHEFNRWLLKFKSSSPDSESHPECPQMYKKFVSPNENFSEWVREWGLCLKFNHFLPKIWIFSRISWETFFISSRKHRTKEQHTQDIKKKHHPRKDLPYYINLICQKTKTNSL